MKIEINDDRYIYTVTEDNGEMYDMFFEEITLITTDFDYAMKILKNKRYELVNERDGYHRFERKNKNTHHGCIADENGATITRNKLTLPK